METQKKTWETPQLIVLARGTPEENVLTPCKTQNPKVNIVGPADQTSQDKCASGDLGNCSNCKERAYSTS